jgi:uncharacterized membrane protein
MSDLTGSIRDRLPFAPRIEAQFHWRGHEVTRLEGFTDAVFAFAVTLLIVALEVPHTFEGLLDVLRGFPAFVLCFAILMMFWNAHYTFFRRYGLQNMFTRVMTMAIIVLVLFFVYPLKFLFTMITVMVFDLHMHHAPTLSGAAEVGQLYIVYGLGFAGAWAFYALLYFHALRKRGELALDAAELIMTRDSLSACLVYLGVCLLSVLLALVTDNLSVPGFVYFLIAPLQAVNGWYHGRKLKAVAPPTQPQPA